MFNLLIRDNEQFDQNLLTMVKLFRLELLFFLIKYVPKCTGFKNFYFLVSVL